ncbi:MAG: class II aldolase/adducin family protein [Alphaproteobacteria bacterium]|nr:class II aldolase/adducin family protein [Alphaproteobacteria bacterium]
MASGSISNRAEWQQARIDLAAALRWSARLGLHEGVCNHYTVMLAPDRFLINPHHMHWSKAIASKLIVIDDKGKTVEGEGRPARTGFNIHTRIHTHTKAKVVLHTHMPYATALACVKGGRLEMAHQNAARFWGLCAYDEEFNGFANATTEGDRMASYLGDGKRVLFLGNHGVDVTGETVADAFDDMYYLERACEVQILAMSTGKPLMLIGDDKARALRDGFKTRHENADLFLDAVKVILDEDEPAYAS